MLAVVEVGVRLPYFLQHPVTDRQSFEVTRKTQTTIDPALTEVAVELVSLREKCACASDANWIKRPLRVRSIDQSRASLELKRSICSSRGPQDI